MSFPTYDHSLDATSAEFENQGPIQPRSKASDCYIFDAMHERSAGSSNGYPGQRCLPESMSHEPCDNIWTPYAVYHDPAQDNTISHVAHHVQSDSVVSPPQYFDTSQSQYRTNWESHMHSYANSQKPLTQSHINTEMLYHDYSNVSVTQQFQELSNLPTSVSEYPSEATLYVHPHEHNTLPQSLSSDYQPPETTVPSYPHPEMAWNTSAITIPSTPYSFDPATSHNMDPVPSSSSSAPLYPVIPTNNAPSSSVFYPYPFQHISVQASVPRNTLSAYPVGSTDNILRATCNGSPYPEMLVPSQYPSLTSDTSLVSHPIPSSTPRDTSSHDSSLSVPSSSLLYPVTRSLAPIAIPSIQPPLPLPARQTLKKPKCQRPPKKQVRVPRKPVAARAQQHPKQRIAHNNSSEVRAPIRSGWWLDTFFPRNKPCTLCHQKLSQWREDRALEHLVSSHILQAVKKMSVYSKLAPGRKTTRRKHLVETEAQFAYAREQVEDIKCRFCPYETSLVLRGANAKQHWEKKHGQLDESLRDMELKRVEALEPDKREWYSYHDKLLFEFPRAVAPPLSEEL